MLSMDEICDEIKKLEECEYASQDICKKLAILYIVKDHYNEKSGNSMKMTNTGMSNHTAVPAMSSPMMMEK